MEEYDVKIFPAAQDDLRNIADSLKELSAAQAAQYFELITDAAASLKTAPESRPLARDSQFRLRGYRTLPLNEYIAFYSLNGKTVELRRIVFAHRQYEGLM